MLLRDSLHASLEFARTAGKHLLFESLRTFEATIHEDGNVRLLEPVQLPEPRRAFVTILPSESEISETALLSETALAQDWNRPEEDVAWSHLQWLPPS